MRNEIEDRVDFENPEISLDSQPSGGGYISARLKEDTPSSRNNVKLFTMSSARCGHINRICLTCHDEWAQDYNLFYDRTVAGRRMLATLVKLERMNPDGSRVARRREPAPAVRTEEEQASEEAGVG